MPSPVNRTGKQEQSMRANLSADNACCQRELSFLEKKRTSWTPPFVPSRQRADCRRRMAARAAAVNALERCLEGAIDVEGHAVDASLALICSAEASRLAERNIALGVAVNESRYILALQSARLKTGETNAP